jgi:hypothetical protein
MKHKIFITLMLAFTIAASAQDTDWNKKYRTGGVLNGRLWVNGFSNDWKLGLVMGFADGTSQMLGENPSKDNREAYDFYSPVGMTYGERITALDNFFADPLNRLISIGGGLIVINMQHQGKDASGLILMLRKDAVAPVVATPAPMPAERQ